MGWTGGLDWWAGLVSWTGELDWWAGLVGWTGGLDWWAGLVGWTGGLDWCGLVDWIIVLTNLITKVISSYNYNSVRKNFSKRRL